MKEFDNNICVFLSLLKAGLWEKDFRLQSCDFSLSEIYKISEAQSVIGILAAGLEHVVDIKAPKEDVLMFVGNALQIEERNKAMNNFIGFIIDQMRKADIYTLLVKGQGVAQCYKRPLWRACGDVDLLLSETNYEKAKNYLSPLATSSDAENKHSKHLALTIDSWVVELHGTLHSNISHRVDNVLDSIMQDLFYSGNVRSWMNGQTQVFLPSVDNDIIYVFTHILQHFFKGGIGLRQVCDWCRLLWTYRDKIDKCLLEKRIRRMGLMTEWKAFAALSVNTLGMPVEAVPMYSSSPKWSRKAERILVYIFETGNFGHNRDTSYYQKYPFLVYKAISFWKNTRDSFKHIMIFPLDAARVWLLRLTIGISEAIKGN